MTHATGDSRRAHDDGATRLTNSILRDRSTPTILPVVRSESGRYGARPALHRLGTRGPVVSVAFAMRRSVGRELVDAPSRARDPYRKFRRRGVARVELVAKVRRDPSRPDPRPRARPYPKTPSARVGPIRKFRLGPGLDRPTCSVADVRPGRVDAYARARVWCAGCPGLTPVGPLFRCARPCQGPGDLEDVATLRGSRVRARGECAEVGPLVASVSVVSGGVTGRGRGRGASSHSGGCERGARPVCHRFLTVGPRTPLTWGAVYRGVHRPGFRTLARVGPPPHVAKTPAGVALDLLDHAGPRPPGRRRG